MITYKNILVKCTYNLKKIMSSEQIVPLPMWEITLFHSTNVDTP